jgi:hypothetical protein
MEPSCFAVEYEEKALPPGRSYLEPVLHLFVLPSAIRYSFLSDNLTDPDASTIRMGVMSRVEVSGSSNAPLVDRAVAKRKAPAQIQSKRASKRRKTLPFLFYLKILNSRVNNSCVSQRLLKMSLQSRMREEIRTTHQLLSKRHMLLMSHLCIPSTSLAPYLFPLTPSLLPYLPKVPLYVEPLLAHPPASLRPYWNLWSFLPLNPMLNKSPFLLPQMLLCPIRQLRLSLFILLLKEWRRWKLH